MRWFEITVYTTEEAIEMVSDMIHQAGAGGVSIEESGTLNKKRDTSLGQWYDMPLNDIPEGKAVIKGYFAEETDIDAVMMQLKQSINGLAEFNIDTGNWTMDAKIVDDDDWAEAWKQYFKPVKVSNKLVIKPTWEQYEPSEEELLIELDPGMAFGTGTHASTVLCMKALEEVIEGGEHVIDIGTGSGILAVTAVKLGAAHVLALDLDPVAVSSAEANAQLNGLDRQITVMESDLLTAVKAADEHGAPLGVDIPVRVVVANILAEIIVQFADDVYNVLQSGGGYYIASGIIARKAEMVNEALRQAGFDIAWNNYEQDWVVIVARKR